MPGITCAYNIPVDASISDDVCLVVAGTGFSCGNDFVEDLNESLMRDETHEGTIAASGLPSLLLLLATTPQHQVKNWLKATKRYFLKT